MVLSSCVVYRYIVSVSGMIVHKVNPLSNTSISGLLHKTKKGRCHKG